MNNEKDQESDTAPAKKHYYYTLVFFTKFDKIIYLSIPVETEFDYSLLEPIYKSCHLFPNTSIIKQLLNLELEPEWIEFWKSYEAWAENHDPEPYGHHSHLDYWPHFWHRDSYRG